MYSLSRDNMSKSTKQTATKPSTDCLDAECFNCFKRGFCRKTIKFDDPDRKPLHFCEKSCMDAFIQDEVTPKNLAYNQAMLDTTTRCLEIIKSDPDQMVLKKSYTIDKMLRTALAARKPKAELERLYALWQECATETLQKISDDKDLEECVTLQWAQAMKHHDKGFPSLILSLGR